MIVYRIAVVAHRITDAVGTKWPANTRYPWPGEGTEEIVDQNKQIAIDVLEAVGGKENVKTAVHCMSRLRLQLKDASHCQDDTEFKAIEGVLGVNRVGEQLQVIIGSNVNGVYRNFCALAGLDEQDAVPEDLDGVLSKDKLTLKQFGLNTLDYLTGSISPILPALMAAGLFKTLQVILGSTLLDVIAETDDLYVLCDMVFNGVFYFLPVYLGFTTARKLGVTPVLGVMLACILLVPSFVEMADSGDSFSVYGIPCSVVSYSQTILPILLSVWVMSFVERFFNRVFPDMLKTTFTPFCTIAVMLPITLCALGPIGSWAGTLIGNAFFAASNAGGIISVLAVGILTALQPFLVVTGMHQVLTALGLTTLAVNGFESFVFIANLISNFAVWSVGIAAFLRFKDAKTKTTGLSCAFSGVVGGLTEPTLYGILLRYPRAFAGTAVGGLLAGLICGVCGVGYYNLGASSILALLSFIAPDGGSNFIFACIAGAVGFVVSLVVTCLVGFSKKDIDEALATEQAS